MGVRQRVGHFAQNANRVGDRQLALRQPSAERFSVHVGHHVIEEAVGLARVVERQDVRVLQAGGHLDLAEEPVRAERGGEVGTEDLHRHLAVVLEVLGEVHRRHAALTQLALEAIAVGEGGHQAIEQLGHAVHAPFGRTVARPTAQRDEARPGSDPPGNTLERGLGEAA